MVRLLLRFEGLAIGGFALWGFATLGGSWIWLLVLFLAPDLSIAAYLAGARTGSFVYNLVHTYLTAIILLYLGSATHAPMLALAGLLLAGHIGVDRALGFGLKYPTTFQDTHIQHV